MADKPNTFWTARENDAHFSEPGLCERRATRFERTIRRRNLIEFGAGGLAILLFGGAMIGALAEGLWDLAAAFLAGVAGTAFVLLKLHRDGSTLKRRPEQPCRTHYHAQLVRQRDLLKHVPTWYLAPLLPGILAIYGVVAARVAQRHGWAVAAEGIWSPLGATLAFFVFIGWLNIFASRKLDRQIEELDETA